MQDSAAMRPDLRAGKDSNSRAILFGKRRIAPKLALLLEREHPRNRQTWHRDPFGLSDRGPESRRAQVWVRSLPRDRHTGRGSDPGVLQLRSVARDQTD